MIVFHMEISSNNAELECALVKAAKRTSSHLRGLAKFAVLNDLPLCLASSWSSKAKLEYPATERLRDIACCAVCGLDLQNKRCFDVKIATDDGVNKLQGICCGCRQVYHCGELPSCSEVAESGCLSYTSSPLNKTFDEDGICAASTPLRKPKTLSLLSPRMTNLQSHAKRSRKRRGSALERLLKEDDSETDRSLSGFLNMVAK